MSVYIMGNSLPAPDQSDHSINFVTTRDLIKNIHLLIWVDSKSGDGKQV